MRFTLQVRLGSDRAALFRTDAGGEGCVPLRGFGGGINRGTGHYSTYERGVLIWTWILTWATREGLEGFRRRDWRRLKVTEETRSGPWRLGKAISFRHRPLRYGNMRKRARVLWSNRHSAQHDFDASD